jgi:hypothetical protein
MFGFFLKHSPSMCLWSVNRRPPCRTSPSRRVVRESSDTREQPIEWGIFSQYSPRNNYISLVNFVHTNGVTASVWFPSQTSFQTVIYDSTRMLSHARFVCHDWVQVEPSEHQGLGRSIHLIRYECHTRVRVYSTVMKRRQSIWQKTWKNFRSSIRG